jgi:hypothetical protein
MAEHDIRAVEENRLLLIDSPNEVRYAATAV